MGKPYSIAKEDFVIRSAPTWWRGPGSCPSDAGLSGMVELLRIVVSLQSASASRSSYFGLGLLIQLLTLSFDRAA